jgi:hypothetical protein
MTQGRKPKRIRNTSGLRNQLEDADLEVTTVLDSLKMDYSQEDSDGSEVDESPDWEELDNQEFGHLLAAMAVKDDPRDADWIPDYLKKKPKKCALPHMRHIPM